MANYLFDTESQYFIIVFGSILDQVINVAAEPAQPNSPDPPAPPEQAFKQVTTKDLFGPRREITIEHEGEVYRLRITRRNKLILQK